MGCCSPPFWVVVLSYWSTLERPTPGLLLSCRPHPSLAFITRLHLLGSHITGNRLPSKTPSTEFPLPDHMAHCAHSLPSTWPPSLLPPPLHGALARGLALQKTLSLQSKLQCSTLSDPCSTWKVGTGGSQPGLPSWETHPPVSVSSNVK